MINEIIQGDALTKLRELESESIDCCITSPPYWALRDYKTEAIVWDAVDRCAHEWTTTIETKTNRGIGHDKSTLKTKPNVSTEYWDKDLQFNVSSSFCSKCNAWKGSLGLEPTFNLYINHLIQIFNEVKRVLKKTGACWVNMGDTYNGAKVGNTNRTNHGSHQVYDMRPARPNNESMIKPLLRNIAEKSLCLIPERFATAMIDQGWILRNKIIWYKPNCMPSSTRDRFTVDWEYLYFFTKSPRYYFETQYEPMDDFEDYKRRMTNRYDTKYIDNSNGQTLSSWRRPKKFCPIGGSNKTEGYQNPTYSGNEWERSALGRIKRAVWKIPTAPFADAHFAVFPPAIVETPLKATCPEYVCKKCGKPREKITEKEYEVFAEDIGHRKYFENAEKKAAGENKEVLRRFKNLSAIRGEKQLGWNQCNCNAGFDGGIVLDCFMGSGTTAIVAMQNARNFVGIELNPEYIKMAMERLQPYLKQQRITAF